MQPVVFIIIGIIIGIFAHWVSFNYMYKTIGVLNIDTSNDTKDVYSLEFNVPLETLTKYDIVRLKIASKTSPNMNE